MDGGETEKAEIHGADLTSGSDIGPVLGGTQAFHLFPLFAIRSKDFAEGGIVEQLARLAERASTAWQLCK